MNNYQLLTTYSTQLILRCWPYFQMYEFYTLEQFIREMTVCELFRMTVLRIMKITEYITLLLYGHVKLSLGICKRQYHHLEIDTITIWKSNC